MLPSMNARRCLELRLPERHVPSARGGRPLPPGLRAAAEKLFGEDFSAVRVHTSARVRQLNALAFTSGSHIYIAPGLYDPETPRGVRLLGHELAHVVQQRTGRVHHPFGHGVAVVKDPALEAESDRMGAALAQWVFQRQCSASTSED
ncbi:uncharacterized protein DUF4157 [Archangium gephyra]|uniref:Uncharacterized protein DUF4157 n=1 Tax=Archangium gephyra TaxID=48 RepID=A0AAC8Q3Y1_9BACT|nr:DUF4157 domain-containing protein [Archangium gephyra]AKJ00551.1 Hypothetical protein AA314_02177 [Archangium gephyra]REG32753.1 uncharacterized protein DUF4157 [Archangium gephyra]